jgi:hypothetical protein
MAATTANTLAQGLIELQLIAIAGGCFQLFLEINCFLCILACVPLLAALGEREHQLLEFLLLSLVSLVQ